MGTWGVGSFSNDNAADWIWELEEADDLSVVEAAIARVLDAGDELVESPEAEEAIAAAEVLARLKGMPDDPEDSSEEVDQWIASHPIAPPAALIEKAIQALQRIMRDPSELLECWQDSDDLAGWTAAMNDLEKRLRA